MDTNTPLLATGVGILHNPLDLKLPLQSGEFDRLADPNLALQSNANAAPAYVFRVDLLAEGFALPVTPFQIQLDRQPHARVAHLNSGNHVRLLFGSGLLNDFVDLRQVAQ